MTRKVESGLAELVVSVKSKKKKKNLSKRVLKRRVEQLLFPTTHSKAKLRTGR